MDEIEFVLPLNYFTLNKMTFRYDLNEEFNEFCRNANIDIHINQISVPMVKVKSKDQVALSLFIGKQQPQNYNALNLFMKCMSSLERNRKSNNGILS